MIVQGILDFLRDVVVNWVTGAASLLGGIDLEGAGAGLGSVASGVGSILGLFVAPSVWGAVVAAFLLFVSIYAGTAIVAVLGRRGAGK